MPGRERRPEDLEAATEGAVLTRGLGRSYGDASLPPPGVTEVIGSRRADRFLALDLEEGVLRAEAGLSLETLQRTLLPRGWSAPVLPGTQHVTLGGMVAADVHGKGHHRTGSLGRHVRALRLRTPAAGVVECTRERHPELFRATLGGMGLTGHILEVELSLERVSSPWVVVESRRCSELREVVDVLGRVGEEWPFTAAWLDALAGGRAFGRGIVLSGRWAAAEEAPPTLPPQKRRVSVPATAPPGLLNRGAIWLFNRAYYWRHLPRVRRGIADPESFFHPLDSVRRWNRLYGPAGFTQYQCVLPAGAGAEVVEGLLVTMRRAGGHPFLVVLKDFGAEGEGILSFPRPGHTLAMDFPVRKGTQGLVDTLNRYVREVGGRVYLAKDAFSRAEDFAAMEGTRLEELRRVRARWDPEGRLRSRQSVRILGDPV